jgi:phosphate-selective porin OprO/OprP
MWRNAIVAGASALAVATPALAQPAPVPPAATALAEDPREARIRELEARVEALAAQIADLRASMTPDVQRVPASAPAAPAPQVTLNNGRPQIATADGQTRVALRGVVQFDAAHYDQESPGGVDNRRAGADPSEGQNARDLSSGTSFRRARLGMEGTVAGDWNYAITAEFGGGASETTQLQQAWVEYAGLRPFGASTPVRLRIGAFPPPTGLENASSSSDLLFVERPAQAELVRNIAGGNGRSAALLAANGERWFAATAFTGALVGGSGDFDEQLGLVGRAAFLALRGDDYGLHLGANLNAVLEPGDRVAGPGVGGTIRLRERPELRVDGTRLVDTGALNAEGLTAYGLEFGGQWKSFYIASEYNLIEVDRVAPASDPSFDGWYVQGSWILTGEERRWTASSGGFGAVRPARPFDLAAGRWGAWELGARYSVLDLNDNAGLPGFAPPPDGVRGGEQEIVTFGVNWFPNAVVRFHLQGQDVRIDRLNPGTLGLATPGAQIGQDFRTITLRSQVSF